MDWHVLGRVLRARRERLGLRMVDVAEQSTLPDGTGLSQPVLSRLERGLVPSPTLAQLQAAAKGYRFGSVDHLLEAADLQERLPFEPAWEERMMFRFITRNPDLAHSFTMIARAWDSLSLDTRLVVAGVIHALADQVTSVGRGIDPLHSTSPPVASPRSGDQSIENETRSPADDGSDSTEEEHDERRESGVADDL